MDKKDFQSQYQTEWWYETSKRIKARDKNTCQMCGCNDKPLSVHHLYYDKGSIRVPDNALITLCDDCHKEQNEWKAECYDLLYCLRSEFTDFEVYHILRNVCEHYMVNVGVPIPMTNINFQMINTGDDESMNRIKFLRQWRMRVIPPELKKTAIEEYFFAEFYKNKFIKKEIEDWFVKISGETIGEYILSNEKVVLEIKTDVTKKLACLNKG